ncbi:Uncharacterised protein [Tsukamurella pulmonis]|nr:Uncharacterised protein [Tsukamurella pulmonis]
MRGIAHQLQSLRVLLDEGLAPSVGALHLLVMDRQVSTAVTTHLGPLIRPLDQVPGRVHPLGAQPHVGAGGDKRRNVTTPQQRLQHRPQVRRLPRGQRVPVIDRGQQQRADADRHRAQDPLRLLPRNRSRVERVDVVVHECRHDLSPIDVITCMESCLTWYSSQQTTRRDLQNWPNRLASLSRARRTSHQSLAFRMEITASGRKSQFTRCFCADFGCYRDSVERRDRSRIWRRSGDGTLLAGRGEPGDGCADTTGARLVEEAAR